MTEKFDMIVMGGGPGGYVAAIRASQLGMKVALVEREHLGGICLNWGCIPTKALLRSAEVLHNMQHAEAYGLSATGAKADLKKVVARSRDVSKQLVGGIGHLMKKHKITVIEGQGSLAGSGTVKVVEWKAKKGTYANAKGVENAAKAKTIATLQAPHIILSTGARARSFAGLEPDGKLVWSYREALVPEKMPKKLLVIGSGAIGSEFASFYLNLGAEVTLVEVMDRVVPVEDEEISKFVQKQFEAQGMKVKTGTTVTNLDRGASSVKATLKDSKGKETTASFDRVIVAVGIAANIEGIGLEGTKVKVERGHIVANEWCETHEKGVYAIGDLTGAPWLAHKASHEGVICVEKIAGVAGVHPLKANLIPGCTYCRPQIASVGLTEAKAKEAGYNVRVGRFPFIGNGKAIALGEPEGMVKTVFDADSGELLGAHMAGAEVTEMIQGYAINMQMEGTEADLMHTVFPHPTLSEMMHESVLDAYGKALHM